ncbi:MAG: SRPBCC domain-containing protein [Limisphaerales bacterium]
MTAKNKAAEDYLGREFVITREFDAPRELVFRTWTDPKHLAQWWGPKGFTNPACEWDVRPGGKIYDVMRSPNGERYPMGGEFRKIVAPEKLIFTTGALDEKGDLLFEFLHTAVFVERNGKTELTLRSRVTMTTAEANKYIGGFDAGMTQSLEKLDELLQKQPFIIERIFDTPVALIWRAITTKEDMSRWYFELAEFKPEVGFEFQFRVEHEGNKYNHRCKVTEVIPQKKIAYTWRYDGHEGNSLVTFELFPEGNQTRLKLTHEGLETFPKLPSFARKNFERGWTSLIGTELKQFVESDGFKPGALEIVSTRVFDASQARVFQAFSEPAQLALWWGPNGFTNRIHEFDLKPDGKWRLTMRGPDGAIYENESKFIEVVQSERVVFQHIEPIHSFRMAMAFADESGKTRLTWRMTFESADEFTRVKDFIGKANEQNFDRLAAHLAANF